MDVILSYFNQFEPHQFCYLGSTNTENPEIWIFYLRHRNQLKNKTFHYLFTYFRIVGWKSEFCGPQFRYFLKHFEKKTEKSFQNPKHIRAQKSFPGNFSLEENTHFSHNLEISCKIRQKVDFL